MASPPATGIQPRFSDELILEILSHLTDADLLSLATVSKHIHDMALLAHLARYGISESDIETNSFDTTSGAVPALGAARFITRIDMLRLRFLLSLKFDRDVAALATLARRLPPIKSIDLEFSPWPRNRAPWFDIQGLLLDLISSCRSRPAITVSPLMVSIARPRKPSRARRLLARLRAVGSKNHVPTKITIDEEQFRQGLIIFSIMRQGGILPSVSIRTFDRSAPIGSLIIVRAAGITDLRFPPGLRLSSAEMSALLTHLKLPLLRGSHLSLSSTSEPALHSFICRHPTLQILRLISIAAKECPDAPPPLPSDVLPQLEHILGSARLLAWILTSPPPLPHLAVITLELDGSTGDSYHAALRGLAARSAADTLVLKLIGWAPWNAPDFAAPTAPERALPHITDLRLTFRFPSYVPRNALLLQWLRLFSGLREVSLFNALSLEAWCEVCRKEFPQVTFTAYILAENKTR